MKLEVKTGQEASLAIRVAQVALIALGLLLGGNFNRTDRGDGGFWRNDKKAVR